MSTGVLYVATGDDYIEEAKTSAESLKTYMPETSVALATDDVVDSSVFDEIIKVEDLSGDFGASTLSPELTPFDKTIFLDTDTYICEDISELFDILDRFDLAVSLAPNRKPVPEAPEPWKEYNTGVIAYRNSESTTEFLERWDDIYHKWRKEKEITRNQQSFTKSLYETEINFYTLSEEYNTRIPFPGFLGGQTKIIHGRHPAKFSDIEESLNSSNDPRVFWFNSYRASGDSISIKDGNGIWYIAGQAIFEKGLGYVAKNSLPFLKKRISNLLR